MKLKFESDWGSAQLVSESGRKFRLGGQIVTYKGQEGRIWAIADSQSACAGHGMGNITGQQAILILPDQSFVKIKEEWKSPYNIIWDIEE